jgi:large subunit ribosomal protein L7A
VIGDKLYKCLILTYFYVSLMGRGIQMVTQQLKDVKDKIVGLKQTLRAVQQGKIMMVYVANDADEFVLRKVAEACNQADVPVSKVNYSQYELGRVCQIEVGAAVVALPK